MSRRIPSHLILAVTLTATATLPAEAARKVPLPAGFDHVKCSDLLSDYDGASLTAEGRAIRLNAFVAEEGRFYRLGEREESWRYEEALRLYLSEAPEFLFLLTPAALQHLQQHSRTSQRINDYVFQKGGLPLKTHPRDGALFVEMIAELLKDQATFKSELTEEARKLVDTIGDPILQSEQTKFAEYVNDYFKRNQRIPQADPKTSPSTQGFEGQLASRIERELKKLEFRALLVPELLGYLQEYKLLPATNLEIAGQIDKFVAERKRWPAPHLTDPAETGLYQRVKAAAGQIIFRRAVSNDAYALLILRGRQIHNMTSIIPRSELAKKINAFVEENNRWPAPSLTDPNESDLYSSLKIQRFMALRTSTKKLSPRALLLSKQL